MNIHHGPKLKPLTTNESLSSLEVFKSNILYGLRLNPDFRDYLEDGVIFGKKTRANPSRDLVDIFKEREVIVENEATKERKVRKEKYLHKSKEERCRDVDLLLEQVANYCPHVPRTDITKDCRSVKEVFNTIRVFYNKQITGASLNEVWNIRRELDESPQVLFARIKQLYLDNLLTTDGLHHVEGRVDEDEEMSPTLLNTIVLHWLQILHPNLRDLVTQRFITQLRDNTYACLLPEISRSVNALLEELSNPAPVNRLNYNPTNSSYPTKTPYRPNKSNSQFRQSSGKFCKFCKMTGKKMFHTHNMEDCLFMKKLNSQNSAVRQVSYETSDWDLQCQEFYEYEPPDEPPDLPQEFVINHVTGDASPVLELKSNDRVCLVTLDTGAPCNLVRYSKAKELQAVIRPTLQKVRMADGTTSLDVVGETDLTLYRNNKPYHLPAIVCRDADTDILAGIPFMKANDVAVRPFSDEIILGGTEFIKYNPYGSGPRSVKKITLNSSSRQVLLPGQSVVFSVPHLKGEVAIEPRWDSAHNKHCKESSFWPTPQIVKVTKGELILENTSDNEVHINKFEPVCNLKLPYHATEEELSKDQDQAPKQYHYDKQAHSPPVSCLFNITHKGKLVPYSNCINLNPDGILTKDEEKLFQEVLLTYDEIFAPVTSTYNGYSGTCEVKVNVGPNPPPAQKGRTPNYGDDGLKELQDYFDDLQARGILSKPEDIGITVENINPSFLVNKPYPSTQKRLVTDFKSIKDYCRPTPSLLPNVETVIRRISSYKYLIKTDMTHAYWQMKMRRDSKKYCGVHTPFKGILVYNVGSMGLPGVESALEELTCLVLGDMVQEGTVCKLADDLIIGGNTVSELLENFKKVLHKFQLNNLKLSPTKTVIAPKSMSILGWEWSAGNLKASPHKTSALSACPQPSTVSGLKSFLGSYRFLSRVICGYANLLTPLEEAIKGKEPKEKVPWTDELSDAFTKAKEAIASSRTITVPRPGDQLSIVTDASVRPGAVSATLYIIRDNKRLLGGFYNSKLPSFQKRWLPCELEGLAISLALHHFAPYILNSKHKPQVHTDSKPCVDAANKLKRGEFSMSARLSTFMSTTSRYNADVRHIPGSLNVVSDFSSRNPVTCPSPSSCAMCKFVAEEMNSVVQRITVEDILTGRAKVPWTNRTPWRDIQEECSTLRKVKFFKSRGTHPGKKSRNLRMVRRYISAGTIIAHDGILINPHSPPLGPIQERIVVPEQILHGLLTMIHIKLDHPTSYQLAKAFSRHFFALDSDKHIKEVTSVCPQCAAVKEIPEAMIPESTDPPPSVIGGRFAADVIRRWSQKILCIRETVTSYTLAELIPDETKETIANTLVKQCNLLRPSTASSVTIRVDPHPANQSLAASLECQQSNSILSKNNIKLELGRALNKNKNCVVDKAIRELIREILILQPEGGPITSLMLSKAVANLNSRYRRTGMSSQELWTKRDQITGSPLPIEDREVIMQQYQARSASHPRSMKCKSHGKPLHPSAKVTVGSLVFVYSDGNKLQARKRYIVTSIEGDKVKLRRFADQQLGNKEYDSNLLEIYRVPSLEDQHLSTDEDSSEEEFQLAPTVPDEEEFHLARTVPDEAVPENEAVDESTESEEDGDIEDEEEDTSGSDTVDDQDETFHVPAHITPATMTREPRTKKAVNRYGEWAT